MCSEKPQEIIHEEALKSIITNELDRISSGGKFVWALFLLCATPNILNGFHVSSYTLLGPIPVGVHCRIDAFNSVNWTREQMLQITQNDLMTDRCTVRNFDYEKLSKMSFTEAVIYTEQADPGYIPCSEAKGSYGFSAPESSFVAEWGLVCEKSSQRTSAQAFLSVGKFMGSFSFGILADNYGRKSAFMLGSAFYILGSLLATFSPWYDIFLAGRFFLGVASSGLFYPAFSLLSENISAKNRSWMSIAFSASYPTGMILSALAGYLIRPWRYLQFTLTVPSLLLTLNCYLLFESPRWLLAKKRYDKAYKIVFKKDCEYQIRENNTEPIVEQKLESHTSSTSLWKSIKNSTNQSMHQFFSLYSTSGNIRLLLICYYMFCVTSLCYYVTALNAVNLSIDRYAYIAMSGFVDFPSYLVPIILLRYTGRRTTTVILYFLTGIALLLVLTIPLGKQFFVAAFAMFGRFGITAVYSIVTLYVTELYPTEIRNSALGTCSAWAHVGSISAPYVVDTLGMIGWYIPTTVCGCSILIAGFLTLTLPETGAHTSLACTTINDGKPFQKQTDKIKK